MSFTLYVPAAKPQTLNRTDALLAAILKQLRGGQVGGFSTEPGQSSGVDFLPRLIPVQTAITELMPQNSKRNGFLCGGGAGLAYIWPSSAMGLTQQRWLIPQSGLAIDMNRQWHGSIVTAQWFYVAQSGNPFWLIEIFK